MVRVLHVIGAMDRAGAETFLMNLYRAIDRSEVQFDFLVNANRECDYDREILELGGRIFRIPRYTILNKRSYSKGFESILIGHPEDAIVHGHIGSAAPVFLPLSTKHNRLAIAHSHSAPPLNSPTNILFKAVTRPVRGKADFYMACSPEAGLDRFGKTIMESSRYRTIANGIHVEDYHRDVTSANKAKETLGFKDGPVFGHVGRLANPKNQSFLLDAFFFILQEAPNAQLILIGKGKDEAMLKKKAADLGIRNRVSFLGIRNDIPNLLKAMDVFTFPSLHEGLPVALVEAQAAGLQCIVSDGVPEAAVLSDRTLRIPLSSPRDWARASLEALDRSMRFQDDRVDEIRQQGFDMSETAAWLTRFYLSDGHLDDAPGRKLPVENHV